MPVRITHDFNQAAIEAIIKGPHGGVAKDLIKRGARVESHAKRNLSGLTGSGPRRVDSGRLRASVRHELQVHTTHLSVRVGTGVPYALYVHDGTGIYGPKKTPIRPIRAKALVFRSKVYGAKSGKFKGFVVVASVKGMKPNPFLKNALSSFHSKSV